MHWAWPGQVLIPLLWLIVAQHFLDFHVAELGVFL